MLKSRPNLLKSISGKELTATSPENSKTNPIALTILVSTAYIKSGKNKPNELISSDVSGLQAILAVFRKKILDRGLPEQQAMAEMQGRVTWAFRPCEAIKVSPEEVSECCLKGTRNVSENIWDTRLTSPARNRAESAVVESEMSLETSGCLSLDGPKRPGWRPSPAAGLVSSYARLC